MINLKGKVLVIGDVMVDHYLFGDSERVSAEAPVLIIRLKKEEKHPGGAMNVFENINSLGGTADLFSFNLPIKKTRVFSKGQQIVRVDDEKIQEKKYNQRELKILKEKCEWADKIVIADYAKGTVNKQLMDSLFPYRNKVIIDPKPKNKELYKKFPYMMPNEKEALEMSKVKEINLAAEILIKNLRTVIIMTRGKKGISVFDQTSVIDYPTKQQDTFNIIGAGDTTIAALALAQASGYDLKDSVEIANKVAGIVVQKIGTNTVTLEELNEKRN